ncbi:hypothetical protein J437_LFUL002382 [Ladona fulva]|uniref:UBC core domain-containing protein n=1 Tax=Ladona fulva TaxID=123851 RepID=A0A8K0NZU1_LADFU|nr:hypothetical protein J437_LFUL002382 [Ladona fulva]
MSIMTSASNVENLSPQIIRRIVKEMHDLANDPPEGIKVILNEHDVTDIQAYIEGPAGTPYAGGVFRVKLALGKDFPTAPLRAFFLTRLFHPNVAASGEICVDTLKRDWKMAAMTHSVKLSKAGVESSEGCAESVGGGPLKKHAGDKKVAAEKRRLIKERKRTLKRL